MSIQQPSVEDGRCFSLFPVNLILVAQNKVGRIAVQQNVPTGFLSYCNGFTLMQIQSFQRDVCCDSRCTYAHKKIIKKKHPYSPHSNPELQGDPSDLLFLLYQFWLSIKASPSSSLCHGNYLSLHCERLYHILAYLLFGAFSQEFVSVTFICFATFDLLLFC